MEPIELDATDLQLLDLVMLLRLNLVFYLVHLELMVLVI